MGDEKGKRIFQGATLRMFLFGFFVVEAINKGIRELCGAMIYMLFTVFFLDKRTDAMAGFLPSRQVMIHHCVSGSHQAQNTQNLFIFDSKSCCSEH